jgi:outer membrane lipoprotein-sorting protein
MKFRFEKSAAWFLLGFVIALSFATSCRKIARPEDHSRPLSSEPESYSATVVRLTEDGEGRQEVVSRVIVADDMRREEWTENGEARALIIRFDSSKSYLLDLGRRLYVETDLNQSSVSVNDRDGGNSSLVAESGNDPATGGAGDFASDFQEEPVSSETKTLPDETLAGQRCRVTEVLATFADGRIEVTKAFRAREIGGLIIKTEAETITANHHVKVTTERRDITLDVSTEAFTIPADFKKVQKLSS